MPRVLNAAKNSIEAQQLIDSYKRKIVGQDDAVRSLVNMVEKFQAGFADPSRTAGAALFLGPTGTGKTRVVEALAEGLFGDARACIKIDCAEYQHGHEIAKLIGSPPGYLGHRETHPLLTQEALNQWHTERMKLSIVLFDEIEKASDTLWNLMLGIMDKAVLTLGDNRRVSFSNVIIVMTSNLGAVQMGSLVDGGLGFVGNQVDDSVLDSKIDQVAKDAAKRKFSPEFFNRIDNVVVFRTLTQDQIKDILNIELGQLQSRMLINSNVKFFYHVLPSAKKVLLAEGYDKKFGARHLKRTIERRIQDPLARLVASGQVMDRDVILIADTGRTEFEFAVEGQ